MEKAKFSAAPKGGGEETWTDLQQMLLSRGKKPKEQRENGKVKIGFGKKTTKLGNMKGGTENRDLKAGRVNRRGNSKSSRG